MPKLNELIYNIKNTRNGGYYANDYKFSDRQLEFIIDYYRAEIAAYNTMGRNSTEGFVQQLPKAEVSITKDFELEGVQIYEADIPELITADGFGRVVTFVGTRNNSLGFQKSTMELFQIDMENPILKAVYFTVGAKLYIASKESFFLRTVVVRGIFGCPRKVEEYTTGLGYVGMDWNYPIPQNYISQLNKVIMAGEQQWMNILPKDNNEDGRDNGNG